MDIPHTHRHPICCSGGPTRRLQLPCFPLPRATSSATISRTLPSLSARGAGRWGPLGNYFTRLGRRPFPSGRWPALKSNPDPWVPHRSSRELGPGGSGEPAEREEQREPAGRGGCCAPTHPTRPARGHCLACRWPGFGRCKRVCSSWVHKDSLPQGLLLELPSRPPIAPSHSCFPAAFGDLAPSGCQARCQAEPVQVTFGKRGLAGGG